MKELDRLGPKPTQSNSREQVAWLRCRILRGMFSDERVVVYEFGSGNSSVFVPQSSVIEDRVGEGRVRVKVIQRGDASLAVLPTGSGETIPVRAADLVSA